jgi:hypothetical protein
MALPHRRIARMETNVDGSWELIRSEPGPDLAIFKTGYDWVKNPRNATTVKAVILDIADWVNVVAITPENRGTSQRPHHFFGDPVNSAFVKH